MLPIWFNQGNCTANLLKWMGNAGSYRILAYLVTRVLLELVLGILFNAHQEQLHSRERRRPRARKHKSAFKSGHKSRPRPSPSPTQRQPREENTAPRKLRSCPAAFASQAARTSREELVGPVPLEQSAIDIVALSPPPSYS